MEVITNLLKLMTKNPAVLVILGVVLAAFALGYVVLRLTKPKQAVIEPKVEPVIAAKASIAPKNKAAKVVKEVQSPPEPKIVAGTGNYKAMVIRNAKVLGLAPGTNVVDFTTIPEPIGEIHMADTSCPVSGGIYTVKEMEDGEIVDYDPRDVPVDVELTPEYAWFATHWDIVKEVFSIPVRWWASTSVWFAAGVLAVLFFVAMSALGG